MVSPDTFAPNGEIEIAPLSTLNVSKKQEFLFRLGIDEKYALTDSVNKTTANQCVEPDFHKEYNITDINKMHSDGLVSITNDDLSTDIMPLYEEVGILTQELLRRLDSYKKRVNQADELEQIYSLACDLENGLIYFVVGVSSRIVIDLLLKQFKK